MVAKIFTGLVSSGKMPIEELAYNHFVRDGCADGNDLHHWLEAENQLTKAASERNENLILSCDNGLHHIWSRAEFL